MDDAADTRRNEEAASIFDATHTLARTPSLAEHGDG